MNINDELKEKIARISSGPFAPRYSNLKKVQSYSDEIAKLVRDAMKIQLQEDGTCEENI